jgi:hypothetical protein
VSDVSFNFREVLEQVAEEQDSQLCTVRLVKITVYEKPFEDGSVGEIEFRYAHRGIKNFDGDAWLIRPGKICGALYGLYKDGKISLYAN